MTSTTHKAMTISERRAGYPLHQRIKVYDPDSMAKRLNQEKTQGKMIVNGINILNKASLDTDIIMDRIKHRRETHNRVERRRRDMLNTLINELAQSMPETATMEPEKCHRALVLRQAISYIRTIQSENNALRAQLSRSTSSSSSSSSSSLSSTSNTLCTPTNDTTTTTTSTATTTLDTKAQNQNL